MLNTKLVREGKRIVVAEIMIPIILLLVLATTLTVCQLKLLRINKLVYVEDTVEAKWMINLGVVLTYAMLDLILPHILRVGIRDQNATKCRIWLGFQIFTLCLFSLGVLQRFKIESFGFHFFVLFFLYLGIGIYKVYHMGFVYNVVDYLDMSKIPKKKNQRRRIINNTENLEEVTNSKVEQIELQLKNVP